MDDLISRQDAIDALEWKWAGKAAIDAIKNLPSAQPEKTGKWIETIKHHKDDEQEYDYIEVNCSECGVRRKIGWRDARYCPNCGAKIEGVTVTENGICQRTLALESAPTIEQPHWIPCSERKPEDTAIVTVETKTFKHKYVCEAVWIPRWSKKAEFDDWEDCSEYNEDEDEYYILEGWYERVHNWDEYSFVGIEDDVIAWMPLPEPYKADMRGEE